MDYVISEYDAAETPLIESLLVDRGSQFVDRLGWDLCVSPEGYERDEYDAPETTYLIVKDGPRHIGSCRVRPVSAGTMLLDHFAGVFPEATGFLELQSGRLWELTRFCRSPHATPAEGKEMLVLLAEALDVFRDDHRITGYLGVVYPEVGRFLTRIGVRFLCLAKSEMDGREAHLICITHCVAAARLAAERKRGADLIRAARGADAVTPRRAA